MQIVCDLKMLPLAEQRPYAVCNGSADLEDEPAAGLQRAVRLRDQVFDYFQSCGAGEDCVARLKLADLQLYLVGFRLSDVGGIGHYEIEVSRIETLQQIALMETNSALALMAGGIGLGYFEGSGRDVGRVDLSLRKFTGERYGDTA